MITIDRSDVLAIFQQLLNEASPHKILRLTGDAKMGKSHLMRAFRGVAQREHQAYCAFIDLRSKLQSPADLLHVITQQLNSTRFPQYHAAQDNLSQQSKVEVSGLRAILSSISLRADESPQQQNRERRLLTTAFLKDLADWQGTKPILLLFDAFDNADESSQDWLFEHFLTGIYPIPHVRAIVAGRTLPAPPISWQDICYSHELHAVPVEDHYDYCHQIGADEKLSTEHINLLHTLCDGKPGMFAELVAPKFGKGII